MEKTKRLTIHTHCDRRKRHITHRYNLWDAQNFNFSIPFYLFYVVFFSSFACRRNSQLVFLALFALFFCLFLLWMENPEIYNVYKRCNKILFDVHIYPNICCIRREHTHRRAERSTWCIWEGFSVVYACDIRISHLPYYAIYAWQW